MSISKNILTNSQQSIINTLLYFDVFNYPLKREEIFENCSTRLSLKEFDDLLNGLLETNVLQQLNGFYFVNSINTLSIEQRVKANSLASNKIKEAYKYSKRIAKFPFVKAVCISGSLSKNYYDEKSDVDYFIVTKANRLWLCRTLFTLHYKTLSTKKREYYCLNYYISESDLFIPDKNHFVAMELAHLVPTVNYDLYLNLLEANNWHQMYLPNKMLIKKDNCYSEQNNLFKTLIESLFIGGIGNWFDDKLLTITLKNWRKKHTSLSQEDFNLQLRSKKHVCKHHTKGYQNKILQLWEDKINLIKTKIKF